MTLDILGFDVQTTLAKKDTFGNGSKGPSYRESNKGSKEKQGPTLSVRFAYVSVKRDSNVYYKTNILVYRLSGFSKIWPDYMTLFAVLPSSRHFNQTQQNSFLSLHDKAAKALRWGHPESCSQAQRSHRITDDVKMCHQCVSDNYYGFSLRSFLVGQFFLTL